MGKISKTFALFLILSMAMSCLALLNIKSANAQLPSNQAPVMDWQNTYGDNMVVESSNLIQTSDGGYAFMDLGYTYQSIINGATIFKVDSKGNIQWSKYISNFTASTIIQTKDKGFEISGWWFGSIPNATLIKTDSLGNIQYNQNYSVLPNLGFNYYPFDTKPITYGGLEGGSIKTSDNGFVDWTVEDGNIIKTDSNNNTQWTKTLTYHVTITNTSAPILLISVIETSDGAIAVLGVAPAGHSTFPTQGTMHLIKLEPFLPVPSPTQLPTPIPTVPEFPTLIILPLFAVATLLSIVLIRTLSKKKL